MPNENLYIKGNKSVLVNTSDSFIYEVNVFCLYKNYYSVLNTVYYLSNEEVFNVESFYKNAHSIIKSELLYAPFWWLIKNNYVKYVKPIKNSKKLSNNDNLKVIVNRKK